MTISWPLSRQVIVDASGRPLLVPNVRFFAAGTTDPLDVFKDAALSVPHEQPVVADGTGRFPRIYIPTVLYAEEVHGPYDNLLWRDDGLGFVPATNSGGSGGGGSVDPTAISSTGDIKWRMDPGILPGWVRMNARTIGSATSGATELADASARALYLYLWQSFPDAIASVTGGRGTTAIGDYNAGKPIAIPTMQGLVAAGLDDMGSTAANRLQVSTNLTLAAGSPNATVASAAGLVIGMPVLAPGVPAGTVIIDISGTALVLSNAAGVGSTGTVAARFSMHGDAQNPGQVGGATVSGISAKNLPTTLPNGSVTVSYPSQGYRKTKENNLSFFNGANNGGTVQANSGADDALCQAPSDKAHTVTIANPNGGVPIATVQPSRLGTFYLKL